MAELGEVNPAKIERKYVQQMNCESRSNGIFLLFSGCKFMRKIRSTITALSATYHLAPFDLAAISLFRTS